MSEKYGQWQQSECGHAAYKIDADIPESLEDDFTYTITARNCQRTTEGALVFVVCATCGQDVEFFDPGMTTVLDEEGRAIPLVEQAA